MLLLVSYVIKHPRELLLAKANDAEAALPLQALHVKSFVDFMRTGAFQVADEIADAHMGLDVDRHVDVCGRAADTVKIDAIGFATAVV